MPQFALGSRVASPDMLGMNPDAPPDLDEPQIGEDPDTAPLTPPESHSAEAGKRGAPRTHAGQNHDEAPPLPLRDKLRRMLRDSLLGGGADIWGERPRAKNIYFLAFEAGRHDRYLTLGNKRALFGAHDTAGWRVLAMRGFKIAARDPLPGSRSPVAPDVLRVLPGYEARLKGLTASVYGGFSYTRHNLTNTALSGQYGRYGLSAMVDFWYSWRETNPLIARFTSGYILAETANRSLSLGLRHGMALPGLPWLIGPEAGWNAARDVRGGPRISINGITVFRGSLLQKAYRTARAGGHISEIPLFAARLRLSGGVEWKDSRKPGGYAEIAAYVAY